ncbi:hypothetical protein O1L44_07420 [Streptomyces noursei]|nr:hypothetical protein [Streptomyces noursei]
MRLPRGRHDQRHPFAVDVAQLDGEPMGQRVIAAHHHVRRRRALLGLMWQLWHTS